MWSPTAPSPFLPALASIFLLDTSGVIWEMDSLDGQTFGVGSLGAPRSWSSLGVQVGPAAVGLGDGRMVVGGRVGGVGGAAYTDLDVFNTFSGWGVQLGSYSSGVEFIAY